MLRQFKNKKKIYLNALYIMVCSVVTFGLAGCEKDYNYIAPPPNPNVPVSFSADIYPIFNANCNTSGCHLNNDNAPDLSTVSIAYDQMWVNDAGDVLVDTSNTGANAANSILYKRMISTTSNKMPPSGILPSSQTSLILLWIEQGAKNN